MKTRIKLKTYREWQLSGYQVKNGSHSYHTHNGKCVFSQQQVVKKRTMKPKKESASPNISTTAILIAILVCYWLYTNGLPVS